MSNRQANKYNSFHAPTAHFYFQSRQIYFEDSYSPKPKAILQFNICMFPDQQLGCKLWQSLAAR